MKLEFTPIGTFYCSQKYRFETPRQGVFADNSGEILLNDLPELRDACRDLAGVERIWILFCFHLNDSWRPFIQPPISPGGRRIGVLATRAPYRPNPIGMSCVELTGVEKNRILVRNHDLLDGTPILDIKPYIPEADSFPDSGVAWLDEAKKEVWSIEFVPSVRQQAEWLLRHGAPDLLNFCEVQLAVDPFNGKRKRVVPLSDGSYEIACRTWRIVFRKADSERILTVLRIFSGYSESELIPAAPDLYGDKEIHRNFVHLIESENQ